jgi:hypothetical protein
MNNARAISFLGLLAAGVFLVASCGGGQTASGGSGGTGMMARGSISKIGSIFVNGIEYDTTGATITLPGGISYVDQDGTAGGTDLMEGMIVTVVGTVADDGVHGKATTVTYNRSLIGEMLVPTVASDGFTLYGQQVVYDPDIRFESQAGDQTTLAAPVPGWVADNAKVEVSGFVLADGTVQASYVKELAELPTDLEIDGPVTSVTAHDSIVVGGTTFTMPPDHDWVGSPIEVGTYVSVHFLLPAASATNLDAQEVEIEEMELSGGEGELGELEGVITAGGNPFTIEGQQVYTDAATRYEHGVPGDLGAGRKIEVLGTFSGGRFMAEVIEFE